MAPTHPLLIDDDDDGHVVVSPLGELDSVRGPLLVDAIRQVVSRVPERVVLNLDSVTFLDSGGCSALVLARREARTSGVPIGIQGDMAPMVRRVLEITMLLNVFDTA